MSFTDNLTGAEIAGFIGCSNKMCIFKTKWN